VGIPRFFGFAHDESFLVAPSLITQRSGWV
jgi:hypothetical protein